MSLPELGIFAGVMGGLLLLLMLASAVLYGGRVRRWAARHGYRILRLRHAWSRGPFPSVSRSQRVFRVTVETPDGSRRDGWLLCGDHVHGAGVDGVEVHWDEV
jgi:hypothetical protein